MFQYCCLAIRFSVCVCSNGNDVVVFYTVDHRWRSYTHTNFMLEYLIVGKELCLTLSDSFSHPLNRNTIMTIYSYCYRELIVLQFTILPIATLKKQFLGLYRKLVNIQFRIAMTRLADTFKTIRKLLIFCPVQESTMFT